MASSSSTNPPVNPASAHREQDDRDTSSPNPLPTIAPSEPRQCTTLTLDPDTDPFRELISYQKLKAVVDNFREKFGRVDAVLDTLHTTLAGVEKREQLQTERARMVDRRLEEVGETVKRMDAVLADQTRLLPEMQRQLEGVTLKMDALDERIDNFKRDKFRQEAVGWGGWEFFLWGESYGGGCGRRPRMCSWIC